MRVRHDVESVFLETPGSLDRAVFGGFQQVFIQTRVLIVYGGGVFRVGVFVCVGHLIRYVKCGLY